MSSRSSFSLLSLALLGSALALPMACGDKEGGGDDGDATDGGSATDGGGSADGGTQDGGGSSGDGGGSTGDGGGSSGDGGGSSGTDVDGDGYSSADGDCDDNDPDRYPGNTEVCDGKDNDCDSDTDEDAVDMLTWYYDGDGDGYGLDRPTREECEAPTDHVLNGGDCDDEDPTLNPGEPELCNDRDDDCDDIIDESPADGGYFATDADGDGLGVPGTTIYQCEGATNEYDCDDTNALDPQVVDIGSLTLTPDGTMDAPWYRIQDGIDNATSCVIVFGGTYLEAIDFGSLDLQVIGVEGSDSTLINATGQNAPAVTISTMGVSGPVLQGFTLAGGTGYLEESTESTHCGCGVYCYDYYDVYCGGGLYVNGADPLVSDVVILGNELPEASSSASGNDEYFTYSYGGGACFVDSAAELSDVTFQGNFADQGGALYVDENSVIQLNQSFILDNDSTEGGGIYVDGGGLTMYNVLSSWNEATTEGGGMYIADGAVAALNVTFGADDAPTGAGISLSGTTTAIVKSTILYGHEDSVGAGVNVGSSASWVGTYNNVWGYGKGSYAGMDDATGTSGNISDDPLFRDVSFDGDPENDDWHLLSGSPSRDAGDPTAALNDPDGTRSDQGAFGGPEGDWY